jgi:hypothetical protein
MKVYIGRFPKDHTKERKIRIRVDKWDTWSMDHTLALLIHPMLIQLKATTHGAPYTDDEDVPVELRSTSAAVKENDWDTDENHFKRWNWILDEMIWAFGQVLDSDADDQFYSGESDLLWQPLDKNRNPLGEPDKFDKDYPKKKGVVSYLMVHGPKHTFKVDDEGMKVWDARKQNAFRLFGKYYQNLWD